MKQVLTTLILTAAVGLPGFLSWTSSAEPNDKTATSPSNSSWKRLYQRPASTPFPDDNHFSAERVLLGRTLFFDPRLSASGSTSCASCHNPGFAWSDGLPRAIGAGMNQLPRRSPTILNVAWADNLMWDGRAEDLEHQFMLPLTSPKEMNGSIQNLLALLNASSEYGDLFARAYPGEPISHITAARAIATFERTIVSAPAPFDRYIAGDDAAISESARRGFALFNTKAACAKCHSTWNFTDNSFHDIGLPSSDRGRGSVLPLDAMQFAFKTPTLRNVDRRAPYMHDGSEQTLEQVIDLYNKGGGAQRPSLSPEIVPLHLTPAEKADLLAFLKTLTSDDQPVAVPRLPRLN